MRKLIAGSEKPVELYQAGSSKNRPEELSPRGPFEPIESEVEFAQNRRQQLAEFPFSALQAFESRGRSKWIVAK